ncbi:myophilin-like [Ostrea edulis]|uniref:myophilin-like n=1 Tax=Ostrea edulis TaxID=37623 RepID=UPI0020965B5E|nr:myophilin-like [Ostrea edulis]XP_048773521.1 myophilin-like [Ostrea edulis]
MAHRPHAYGLTGEVQRKIKGKYDEKLEQGARLWIEAVLDMELVPGADQNTPLGERDFQGALKNGVILCRLMNAIKPGTIRKINENTMAFKMMENIESFLKAAQDYGCREIDLFQVVDLYERQNMTQVVNGIFALGRLTQKNGFQGPALGPKEADYNPRNFDEDTMKAGQTVIGLQAGSNRGASQSGMNFGKTRSILD